MLHAATRRQQICFKTFRLASFTMPIHLWILSWAPTFILRLRLPTFEHWTEKNDLFKSRRYRKVSLTFYYLNMKARLKWLSLRRVRTCQCFQSEGNILPKGNFGVEKEIKKKALFGSKLGGHFVIRKETGTIFKDFNFLLTKNLIKVRLWRIRMFENVRCYQFRLKSFEMKWGIGSWNDRMIMMEFDYSSRTPRLEP